MSDDAKPAEPSPDQPSAAQPQLRRRTPRPPAHWLSNSDAHVYRTEIMLNGRKVVLEY